jgi:hypothetical protein
MRAEGRRAPSSFPTTQIRIFDPFAAISFSAFALSKCPQCSQIGNEFFIPNTKKNESIANQ